LRVLRLAIIYFALSALGCFLANYPARWAGLFTFRAFGASRDWPSGESSMSLPF